MAEYAVITENDESPWDDSTGDLYHYPNTYKGILVRGCRVIYYKGKLTNKEFGPFRLSDDPHYFGVATIGDSITDDTSGGKNFYCEILDHKPFKKPVLAKQNGEYLEPIPESRKSNYWRSGVRKISKETYERVMSGASIGQRTIRLPKSVNDLESFGFAEGKKRVRYTSYYERNPVNRKKAVEIHGTKCQVCEFDFEETYGETGKGFIEVHHNKPVSETGETIVDPRHDLSVVCPNCHRMIHRKKNETFTVAELRAILNTRS